MGKTMRQAMPTQICLAIALLGSPLSVMADNSPAHDAANAPPLKTARDATIHDLVAAQQQLAQSTPPAGEGQTLQLGNPPPPRQGQTLQLGSPPPPRQGQTLQLGTPPPPGQGQSLQLGTPPPPKAGAGLQIGGPVPGGAPTLQPADDEPIVSYSVPWLRAEGAGLPDNGSRADFRGYFSAAARAVIRPKGFTAWSLQGTLRADAYRQTGQFHENTTKLDYGETFVRYDNTRTRVTLGAQTILWGRVDEIPPTDQMSVQDITRAALNELPDRRRAVPALRIEHSFDKFKVDAVLMPWLRPAELPHAASIWHPIRQEDGRILGIGNQLPLLNAAVRLGTIGKTDDFDESGGAGIRVSHIGRGFDASVTAQRTRRSLPYYQFDPAVRAAVLRGVSLPVAIANGSGPTFREVHPYTWVLGGDAAIEALGGTVRAEAAYLSDVPVTTVDARMETHDGLDWVLGYEFFPGDTNSRVTLQLAGHHVFGTPATLDRTRIFAFLGEVEIPFAQERWIFNTRFSLGLNDRDIYVNPKLRFVGWEPHEFYIGANLFSGSQRTANGFFEDNNSLVLGWRAQF